ncbi:leucine-rich repeat-containing protein 74A isoform X4 [Mauremys reevesii]|uniref:leucine-rich repeat-containing protein 74A isoform X4 n=1 Tax=Mauremys reevesii TaxID=260615 RepID=UPI00193F554F|nr:leucine-rich repeat-containing protein 74A isoform X4 [Mauremys reevesii]
MEHEFSDSEEDEDQNEEMSEGSLSVEFLLLADQSNSPAEEKTRADSSDTDLEIEDPERSFATMKGAELYLEACKLVGVVPVSYFLRNMEEPYMNLNHHGLGPQGAKAIAIALVSNTTITHLELEDNWILAEGVTCLVQMLRENCYIQELNVSNNHIGTEGAEAISRMFLDNISSLRAVQLSGNNFREETAQYFAEALVGNYRVKELDLSHNEFSEKGGEHLGQMLANNEALEFLNLSWNHLRMKGAVALGAGLRVNGTLKILDLSWNGFGNEGALALGEALKLNNILVKLDISSNHINNEGAGKLAKGLEVNGNLKILKLSHNPLTVEGAVALVTSIRKNPKSKMEEINISNVLVNGSFLKLLDVVCQVHPELDVIYGGVRGFISKKPEQRPDPMKLIQQSRIPLDRAQIGELVHKLDRHQTGMVDYRSLVDTQKQMVRDQRWQLRREESRQKKEKHKSEHVLQTFKTAVEMVTSRSSLVMCSGQKPLALPKSDLAHFPTTSLSSWCQPAITGKSTSSQNSAEPAFSEQKGSSSHQLSQSEPHSASRDMSTSDLEVKFYSQRNLSISEAQTHSQYSIATSDLETYSKAQSSDNASSYRVMPRETRCSAHESHYLARNCHAASSPQKHGHSAKSSK